MKHYINQIQKHHETAKEVFACFIVGLALSVMIIAFSYLELIIERL